MRSHLPLAVACAAVVFAGAPVGATSSSPDPLPIDTTATATVSQDEPAQFSFTAPASGVLLVAVQADDDVQINVTYADGSPLPDSQSDHDILGNPGNEQLAVSIPSAGEFLVAVSLHPWAAATSAASFEIGGAFVPIGGREFAKDADGPTRDQPIELTIGEARTDETTATGDLADWHRLTADRDGVLVVTLDPLSPDVWLQFDVSNDTTGDSSYGSGDPAEAALPVAAGDVVFIRVAASGSPTGGYTLLADYGAQDADGTLATARPLEVGTAYEDTERVVSDREDWFAVTAPSAGTLTITTSPLGDSTPDLVLELHLDESSGAVDTSDRDLDTYADESLTVDVTAGQTVFVVVRTYGDSPPTGYRIIAELG